MISAKRLIFFRDFVPEYKGAKFGDNWTTNKGGTLADTSSSPIFYQNSPDERR